MRADEHPLADAREWRGLEIPSRELVALRRHAAELAHGGARRTRLAPLALAAALTAILLLLLLRPQDVAESASGRRAEFRSGNLRLVWVQPRAEER